MRDINFPPFVKKLTVAVGVENMGAAVKGLFIWVRINIQKIPLWVVPLAMTLLFFMPVKDVYFNEDGLEYLGQALNVYKGIGLVNMDQMTPLPTRIFFPLYMAFIFRIFGPSNIIAYSFVHIFYVFDVLMIYFLGKKLFHQWIGLLASLLILTSFSVNEWSTIVNVDFITPFFALGTMLVLVSAFETQKGRWFFLAGLSISAGFLVKETGIVASIIPALLWLFIKKYRNRHQFLGVSVALLVVAVCLVGWYFYAQNAASQGAPLLGNQGKDTSQTIAAAFRSPNFSKTIVNLIISPFSYYKDQIAPNFFFAPIFVLAWGYVAVMALRGDDKRKQHNLILILFLIPFLPQILYQGMYGFRATQGVTVFFLCYLALGVFLWDITELLRKQWEKVVASVAIPQRLGIILQVGLILVVLTVQSLEHQIDFVGRPRIEIARVGRGSMLNHWERFNTLAYMFASDKKWATIMETSDKVSQWLEKFVPVGTPLMMTSSLGRLMTWSSAADYPIFFFPYVQSNLTYQNPSQATQLPEQHVLFLQNLGSFQRVIETQPEYDTWSGLTEEKLLELIRLRSIKYILTGPYGFEMSYFIQHPGYVLVADYGSIQVFEVISSEPDLINIFLRPVGSADEDLRLYKELSPESFIQFDKGYLQGILGLSEEARTQLLSGKFLSVPLNYALDAYLSSFKDLGKDQLQLLVAIQEQNARLDPNNPWPFILLGRLYQALGKSDQMKQVYQQAAIIYRSPGSYLLDWGNIDNYINFIKPEYQLAYFVLGPAYRSGYTGLQGEIKNFTVLDFQDAFSTDPTVGVYNTSFIIKGVPHGVLFMPPTTSREFLVKIPDKAELIFGLALAPGVWNIGKGDGVQFSVFINDGAIGSRIFTQYVDPKNVSTDRDYMNYSVNLSPWAGQTVTLTLSTDPGPNGDASYDWAGWGEPRIVVPVQYDFLSNLTQASQTTEFPDQLRVDQMEIDYLTRPVLFAHPHSSASYEVTLTENPTLMFGMGMDPSVWDASKGDGVDFKVYVVLPEEPNKYYRVFHRYLDPKNNPDDRQWVDAQVDLSRFGGKRVQIKFETTAGPNSNSNFDWAGWSRPVLVDGLSELFATELGQP